MKPTATSFETTHWSIIGAANGSDSASARAALEFLCGAYWLPVYGEVRRRGHAPADAQDLTQSFFAGLLRDGSFASARRELGRFRSYLLGALKHFLADEHDRATAIKRGGGTTFIAFDAMDAEQRLALEPATDETPERAFDRRWAAQVAERAIACIGEEQRAAGKWEAWEILRAFLGRTVEPGEYESIAPRLGIGGNAIAAMVRRLRQRARELMLADVTHTVSNPAEAEAELRALFS